MKKLIKKIRKAIAKILYVNFGISEIFGHYYEFIIEYVFIHDGNEYRVYAESETSGQIKFDISNYPFRCIKFSSGLLRYDVGTHVRDYYEFGQYLRAFKMKQNNLLEVCNADMRFHTLPTKGIVNVICNEDGEKYLGTFIEDPMSLERRDAIITMMKGGR